MRHYEKCACLPPKTSNVVMFMLLAIVFAPLWIGDGCPLETQMILSNAKWMKLQARLYGICTNIRKCAINESNKTIRRIITQYVNSYYKSHSLQNTAKIFNWYRNSIHINLFWSTCMSALITFYLSSARKVCDKKGSEML